MDGLVIKPATRGDLNQLNLFMHSQIPSYHERKLDNQETGISYWLVAWLDSRPVGHAQVRFDGSQNESVNKYVIGNAHIDSLIVDEEYRGQGIGTKLLAECERIAKSRGYHQIGLAVASTTNPKARRLYERLRYQDWGRGDFKTSWEIVDEYGTKKLEEETCTYLIKTLD